MLGFPGSSDSEQPACNAGDSGQGQEDPLEKGMATHSRILAWRIPWTEESRGPQSTWSQRAGQDWATNTCTFLLYLESEPYDLYEIQSMTTYFKSGFFKKKHSELRELREFYLSREKIHTDSSSANIYQLA